MSSLLGAFNGWSGGGGGGDGWRGRDGGTFLSYIILIFHQEHFPNAIPLLVYLYI
jgi:hypothetical protein